MAAPAQQKAAGPLSANSAFLEQLRVDNEPVVLLGQYFARVAETATHLGIGLAVEPIERLLELNDKNRDNWRPLFPAFNPAFNRLDDSNTFCLIAYSEAGEPVASGACRLYDWAATNYSAELESLRLLYDDPTCHAGAKERCTVTAQRARAVSGRVVYAGAAWCHPMMRGRSLSSLIPRTSKALALAKWNFDHMVGLMEETSMRRGLAQRFGYSSPEMGARMSGRSGDTLNFAVLSMPREEVVQHIRDFSAGDGAQVDSVIDRRLA